MWSLRNDKQAIWGKVLTDGVYVTGTVCDDDSIFGIHSLFKVPNTFYNVTLRVKKHLERLNPNSGAYPVLDIAYSDGYSFEFLKRIISPICVEEA